MDKHVTPGPVAWIQTVPESEATGELSSVYAAERDPGTGKVDHILKVHSLAPQTLSDHARLYHTIMHAQGELPGYERELIGLVVSNANGCRY
ncbi:MAG: alkylhydroperoxidase family enzyme [Pseudohongiellaceae bacterium]|jgi:alkylhydroperoxidase family enzyme